MKTRPFGNTGLHASEVGLGCASYWGKQHFSEAKALRVVRQALDSGITYFDTGHSYSGGNAEPRLGKALQGTPTDKLLISSKAGTRLGNRGKLYKDFSPHWLRHSVEQSVKHLGLERLPVLLLHGPVCTDFTDELATCMAAMKTAGLIGHAGVNSFDDDVLELALQTPWADAVMLDYHLLKPERGPLIQRWHEAGRAVIAGNALGGGMYHPKNWLPVSPRRAWYLARAMKNHRENLIRGLHCRYISHQPNMTAAQIAMRYVLNNGAVSTTAFGTTRAEHVKEVALASRQSLDSDLATRLAQTQRRFQA